MDFLVISGASLIYIYSLFVLLGISSGHSYFDSATMIITFVLIGKYLEVLGKKSAVDTLDKIKSQIPTEATIVKNGIKKVVSLEEIKVDDIVEIKTGEKASVDGIVISGKSNFDESSISGESIPVNKTINDKIVSGTVNLDSVIRYQVIKDYEHSTLNNIVTIIEDSLSSKPKIENSANELSKYFSISILTIALFSFLGWYFYNGEFENSLIIAISVIIIACPCALALATPIASLIGISLLAKKGLLFKEAKYIETFAKATTLIIDKTGTITKGQLSVVNHPTLEDKRLQDILYSLVDSSTHPISLAVKQHLLEQYTNLKTIELEDIKTISAKGLSAVYDGQTIIGGNSVLLEKNGIQTTQNDYSIFHFAYGGKLIATFELEDEIKENAKDIVDYLNNQDIKVIMCTGDNEKVASKVAHTVGIENFKANMSPIQKAEFVQKLKEDNQIVIMAGDGVNDAPALARADIGIAMGNGADVAIGISDIVVLNNSLSALKDSFKISKRTYSFIKQNLAISLIYNIITIPLAVAGYVIPLIAALSMSLSSLLVVGNSMRIRK
jgi:Cu+-exporting ATPase